MHQTPLPLASSQTPSAPQFDPATSEAPVNEGALALKQLIIKPPISATNEKGKQTERNSADQLTGQGLKRKLDGKQGEELDAGGSSAVEIMNKSTTTTEQDRKRLLHL